MAKIPDALYEQKERTIFWCPECRHRWEADAERVEPSVDSPHPFEYFATCPKCGEQRNESPQIKGLYRAWLNITGSKSTEISNKNLVPPDPEKFRFNALRHGMYAKKAKYFPAKEGRYPECSDCGYAAECEVSGVCLELSKIRMMVQRAVDHRDPKALGELMKTTQADLFVMLQRMFSQVFQDGVTLEAPVWAGTKEGYVLVQDEDGRQVMEKSAHPLLPRLIDMVAKNSLSLSDMLLTPKTSEEAEAVKGHLEGEKESREQLSDYRQQRNQMLEQFLSGQAALDANAKRAADPVAAEALREIETGQAAEEDEELGMEAFPGIPGGSE